MSPPLDDETRYRLFKLLESKPELSQRELASEMGMSLGKVNYCLRAVMERGWVKVKNFTRHPNKRVYAYYLTAKGVVVLFLVLVWFFLCLLLVFVVFFVVFVCLLWVFVS